MAKKNLSDDPLVRLAQKHGGALEIRLRKHGVAYVFRYRLGKKNRHKSFRAGTPQRVVRAFMATAHEKILFEKHGIASQRKRVSLALRFNEIWQWFEKNRLHSKYGRTKAYQMRYAAKKFEVFLRIMNLHRRSAEVINENNLLAYQEWLLAQGISKPSSFFLLLCLRNIFRDAVKNEILGNFPFPK